MVIAAMDEARGVVCAHFVNNDSYGLLIFFGQLLIILEVAHDTKQCIES